MIWYLNLSYKRFRCDDLPNRCRWRCPKRHSLFVRLDRSPPSNTHAYGTAGNMLATAERWLVVPPDELPPHTTQSINPAGPRHPPLLSTTTTEVRHWILISRHARARGRGAELVTSTLRKQRLACKSVSKIAYTTWYCFYIILLLLLYNKHRIHTDIRYW